MGYVFQPFAQTPYWVPRLHIKLAFERFSLKVNQKDTGTNAPKAIIVDT